METPVPWMCARDENRPSTNMIRDTLSSIGGIGLYGVVSVALFFATFLGVLIWAARLKKSWLSAMSRLPLEPDDEPGHAAQSPNRLERHE
jgi:hypothetical protein